jgi:hypothetical protein
VWRERGEGRREKGERRKEEGEGEGIRKKGEGEGIRDKDREGGEGTTYHQEVQRNPSPRLHIGVLRRRAGGGLS